MTKSTGVGRGAGGGAPSKYKAAMCRQARSLTKLGATDREVAEFFEVTETTLNEWKHRHPKFAASLKLGKAPADKRVEKSLYRRATGYTFDSEEIFVYEGEEVRVPIVKHVPPDTTAMIFWLKNRKPKEWRDRRETEISTPPGRPLEVASNEPELIGAYFARLATIGAERRADPGPHPRVVPDGQEPDGSEGGPGSLPGG